MPRKRVFPADASARTLVPRRRAPVGRSTPFRLLSRKSCCAGERCRPGQARLPSSDIVTASAMRPNSLGGNGTLVPTATLAGFSFCKTRPRLQGSMADQQLQFAQGSNLSPTSESKSPLTSQELSTVPRNVRYRRKSTKHLLILRSSHYDTKQSSRQSFLPPGRANL
jgi:hypothetical protein